MSEQKQVVETILSKAFVNFSADLRGPTKRDNWECDEWSISFVRPGKKDALELPYFTGTGHRKLMKFGNPKPQAPHAADVLYSLILDADSTDDGFDNWCDNLGYDSDSIKALRTYDECRELIRKLRAFFSAAEISVLRDALQDY